MPTFTYCYISCCVCSYIICSCTYSWTTHVVIHESAYFINCPFSSKTSIFLFICFSITCYYRCSVFMNHLDGVVGYLWLDFVKFKGTVCWCWSHAVTHYFSASEVIIKHSFIGVCKFRINNSGHEVDLNIPVITQVCIMRTRKVVIMNLQWTSREKNLSNVMCYC